jgi:hypothetical protein
VGLLAAAEAAQPFNSATITKLQNRVSYGERKGAAQSSTRAAQVQDVIRANNFLLSESESRAELQYPDGSLVRIGQNTVFSFDAESRTLTLDKGSLIFHIPKGSGGGTIKTPSLTAAITGTAGKVSTNIIAIVEGTVKLIPSGRLVHAFEFARKNADGSITIGAFDPSRANDGALVEFNGLMPGFPQKPVVLALEFHPPELRDLEVLHRANNLPGSIEHFFIDRNRNQIKAPKDKGNDQNTGRPPIY